MRGATQGVAVGGQIAAEVVVDEIWLVVVVSLDVVVDSDVVVLVLVLVDVGADAARTEVVLERVAVMVKMTDGAPTWKT